MDISQEILSDITVHMKYAKYVPGLERRETWDEIVTRNMDMHIKKYPHMEMQIRDAYEYVFEKKVLPSMRSLQFGGKPIEINPTRIFNCSYLPIDHIDAFSEVMFLLLGGTGVGFSVQKHHVEKLPEIRKPNPNRTRRYLIGDSIEGWADAVKVLVKAYFGENTSTPVFDFSDIRPKGAMLVTSGGKAPGPQPLKDCLHNIKKVLDSKHDRDKLSPIEVHDIVCHIADAVLAGGIRRAALISLFSADDDEMIAAKSGAWWELNPQRGRANNSAVLLRHKIDKDFFMDLWKRVELSGAGEPGIYFSNDKDWGTNPCAEISLRPHQFCVAGDTKLITRDGLCRIDEVVDKDIEIWNGKRWSAVTPFQTGVADRLHRVFFSDGSFLDATDNHKFLVKTRFETTYREVETLDLIELLRTTKYGLQIPRANVVYEDGKSVDHAYEMGFILGDGCCYNGQVIADLYKNDLVLELDGRSGKVNKTHRGTEKVRIAFPWAEYSFCETLKYDEGLPSELFTWDRESILQFVAGWADADGTQASKGIRIYGREDKIRDAQMLLTKIGIDASVNLMENEGVETNLGLRKNAVWYLQITKTCEIPARRLRCDNEQGAKHKGKHQLVVHVETLNGLHPSFCLTEPDLHQCVFNNVLTKQCNLCEVNVSNIESQEDFNERVRAATFIGTLQAGYTNFHYLRDVWQRTTEKEALIGVGMTGIGSGVVLNYNMKEAAGIVKKENERVAELICINKAARTTTVKPSGTSSIVLGTSSGIHAWYNDYYLRRIRVGKNEAIYSYLLLNHPELVEDEFFRPHDTAVITIPQKAPAGSILRTESALDLLERVKKVSLEWIKAGHRSGANSHNVSATISIKPDEWETVGEWMWRERDIYNGLSVLNYDGGSYQQAPFEDCDKEKYDTLMASLTAVDLTKVVEFQDNTNLAGEVACGASGCELK